MPYDFDVIRVAGGYEKLGAFEVCPDMKNTGWVGGQFVKFYKMESYPDGQSIRWTRQVCKAGSDKGTGFILRGSYEPTDHFTSKFTKRTGEVTVCYSGEFLMRNFETLNLAERTTPGTGLSLTYTLNDFLYLSGKGLLTSEQETPDARRVGICSGTPEDNNNYVGLSLLYP